MPKFRCTVTFEYEADPANYYSPTMDTRQRTVAEMIAIDLDELNNDRMMIIEMAECSEKFEIKIEEVK